MHLTGYDLPLAQLQRERKLDSLTPGHPENVLLPGMVEVTTGPLGQGVANAVGLALAATHVAAEFNDPNLAADRRATEAKGRTGSGSTAASVSALTSTGSPQPRADAVYPMILLGQKAADAVPHNTRPLRSI